MTEPAAQPVPPSAALDGTRNPAAMVLGVIGALLLIAGAMFLDWLSGVEAKGTEAGVAIFWSTDIQGEPSFFASAGFVILILAAITLLGAALGRAGWMVLGGVLSVIGFLAVTINVYRFEGAELGIGDLGIGLWAILVGGVLAVMAGVMARRAA